MADFWWRARPAERYWLETTDRADIGRDLHAPQANEVGHDFAGYSLITALADRDVVFHYSKRGRRIAHWSRVLGEAFADEVIWAAHGRSARGKQVAPYARPGWRRGLTGPYELIDPVTLAELRANGPTLTTIRDGLRSRFGDPLYFPLELSERRELRPTQFYISKVPRQLVEAIPGLAAAADEAQRTEPTAETPAPRIGIDDSDEGYAPEDEKTATARRDPFSVDPDVVDRGLRGHARTQNQFADYLIALGFKPRRHRPGEPAFDLGCDLGGTFLVSEVKSITTRNEERQLRLGLGQVLRYRHLMSVEDRRAQAVLVVERKPSDDGWLRLAADLGVVLVWPPEFARLAEALQR